MNIYDVIVVGSGNAALCAALSAKDHGAKNILICFLMLIIKYDQ